jgi:hypothetical protein
MYFAFDGSNEDAFQQDHQRNNIKNALLRYCELDC